MASLRPGPITSNNIIANDGTNTVALQGIQQLSDSSVKSKAVWLADLNNTRADAKCWANKSENISKAEDGVYDQILFEVTASPSKPISMLSMGLCSRLIPHGIVLVLEFKEGQRLGRNLDRDL
ncbi:hypothetical protein N7454_008960 [Penicillium verhagenii]|nr:hypothetical protein N7454_008960 [Penicillium verhagenii]